ncbi:hypothetical protein U9M48_033935 [Paspalum notatum var. saurae]|uniref:NAD-dependent epimerase/dehydratase domain-containing protein n=1 Tax=Paspalum notatum var. saurae TaxID=547442 RepID=A0AAQ3U849_PASNO
MVAADEKKTACVTGGNGYIASALIKMLLQKGYAVKTTVRNPDDMAKNSHLRDLQALGAPLAVLRADLSEEGSFDEAVAGCDLAFLVAAPVNLASEDPEKEVIEAAVLGTLNVMRSCAKAGTVKRVVLTSSSGGVYIRPELRGDGHVLDEASWSDVEYLRAEKPPLWWAYCASKVLVEKAACRFAEEHGIRLVTVCPVSTVGTAPAPVVNTSVPVFLSFLTGDEAQLGVLKGVERTSGSVQLVHIDDLCRAELFVAEEDAAAGRYICCGVNTTVVELARFLARKYPQYGVKINFTDDEQLLEKPRVSLSSAKLVREGFEFKYKTLDEIYDDVVEYGKALGILRPASERAAMSSSADDERRKTACVTGGNGYIASMLIKMLLEDGYAVKTTVRNPDDKEKNSHLTELQALGPLEVLRADLDEEGSFDEAVAGCDYVFLVAAPVNLRSKDPEKELVEAAVRGTLNVMRSCARARTVKRVVLTSSAAAVTGRQLQGDGHVLDEESWSDVDYLTANKAGFWGYPVSKVLLEKAACRFAEEHGINLVTVCPVVAVGAAPAPNARTSVPNCLSLLSGDEAAFAVLKAIERSTGCVPLVHVDDLCRAELFVAEEAAAAGMYVCCSVNTTIVELARFLEDKYPPYDVKTNLLSGAGLEKPRVRLSSAKLVREGFEFEYKTLDDIFDDMVEYGKALGILAKERLVEIMDRQIF